MTIKELKHKPMKKSTDVYNLMAGVLAETEEQDRQKEHFWVLGLNARNHINYIDLVHLGTLTQSCVHPREVFKVAIMKDSASIIACHNHPSGDCSPSQDDLFMHNRLKDAGKIIGIQVLDHIIIGSGCYLSLEEYPGS